MEQKDFLAEEEIRTPEEEIDVRVILRDYAELKEENAYLKERIANLLRQRPCAGGVPHKTVFLIARDACSPVLILQNAYAPPVSLWTGGAVCFAGDAGLFGGYVVSSFMTVLLHNTEL